MKLKLYILFYLLSILASCSSQKKSKFNTKIVKGIIIDGSGPLPGAYIQVKNTKRGTIADIDGKFETNINENEKLIISFIGFESKEVTITDKNYYEVNLEVAKPFVSRKEQRRIKREIRKKGFYIYPD